jgi:large subunit ribosomal protein L35
MGSGGRAATGSACRERQGKVWNEGQMPKLKTHRGAAKRFKRTKKGKFLRGKAFKQHILSSKSTKRKRTLRGTTTVADVDAAKLARMLPYK